MRRSLLPICSRSSAPSCCSGAASESALPRCRKNPPRRSGLSTEPRRASPPFVCPRKKSPVQSLCRRMTRSSGFDPGLPLLSEGLLLLQRLFGGAKPTFCKFLSAASGVRGDRRSLPLFRAGRARSRKEALPALPANLRVLSESRFLKFTFAFSAQSSCFCNPPGEIPLAGHERRISRRLERTLSGSSPAAPQGALNCILRTFPAPRPVNGRLRNRKVAFLRPMQAANAFCGATPFGVFLIQKKRILGRDALSFLIGFTCDPPWTYAR